ncbi:MAG: cobalamin-binding protein [Spirochaetia bacterium]|nr:cobalamin-binding protein [Spirochaetia bacterium]
MTGYTERPSYAKKEKPIVSSFISGNLKKIVSLNPDLVIGFSDIQSQIAKDLIELGINVLITNQRSIFEILENMKMISALVGKYKEGSELVNKFSIELELLKNKSENLKSKPRIFFQEWNEPIISGIHWVSEAINYAGGIDIFENLRDGKLAFQRIVTKDDVLQKNPHAIIGSWCGKKVDYEWIRSQTGWSDICALKNNNLFEIDSSIILQPGPALFLEGIPKLKSIIENVSY